MHAPPTKRRNAHSRPLSDREKRREAEKRRARLLGEVTVPCHCPTATRCPHPGGRVPVVAPAAPAKPLPARCGYRWHNAQGQRRRCHLPVHDLAQVAHKDRSGACAWHPVAPSAAGASPEPWTVPAMAAVREAASELQQNPPENPLFDLIEAAPSAPATPEWA